MANAIFFSGSETDMVTDELMELAVREYADEHYAGEWLKVTVAEFRAIQVGVRVANRDRGRCRA